MQVVGDIAVTTSASRPDGTRPTGSSTPRGKSRAPEHPLQTRDGYFDLPPAGGSTILPYEMPLIQTLNATQLPRAFDYRAVALRFGDNGESVQHTLVMEVPMSNFTFTSDKEKKTYRAQFSLMALVKNAEGRVVQKLSRDFPLEGALDRLDAARAARIPKSYWLQPGRYTLGVGSTARR